MFYPEVLILPFVLSIALLLVYLSLENPADYTDKDLGILNRNALVTTAASYFEQQKSFEVMGIHVDGLHSVREVFGVSGEKEILNQIARFLTSVVQNKVFYTAGQQFFILSSMSDNEWNYIADELVKRFKHPFTFNGVDVVLSINICMASSPNTVKCIEDVTDFIEYTQHVLPSGENLKAYLTEKELHSQKRTKQIQQILKTAIVKKQFKVYYQPIFSLEKGCYSSAEALIRLQNDELGFISPDEFIPIAEKSGLIIEIGRYVFREVCSFIADERLCDYGIECIDVNLSAVQCMQERLHEELVAIMDQYNLPYNFINLEITETAAVASSETLRKNMDKLINYGVNFSLDDFGTGFSNMTHLIQYPFHTIKIDKSMLWSAMEDEKAMMALKYTIAMIKDMNMDLIVEGVETKEQVELLSSLECKFFQGYYYSKAIPEEDFLALLKK
ncbi:MAG: EAL domain-containing protein [Erysipelotrichales bacterium]|nr:EAL domain-containing protein [Erysipelotrichales bacterium]